MSDPWIRVNANLWQKPIAQRGGDALGVTPLHATSYLVAFWGAVAQHAVGGHVADYTDTQLERWGQWTGRKGRFAKFIREHHLDADGKIKDWDEYQGKLEDRREKDRKRKADVRRTSCGRPQEVREMSAPTLRYDTELLKSSKNDEEVFQHSETPVKATPEVDSPPLLRHQPENPVAPIPDIERDPRVSAFLAALTEPKRRAWVALLATWSTGDMWGAHPHPTAQHIATGLAEAVTAALPGTELSAKFVRSCIVAVMQPTTLSARPRVGAESIPERFQRLGLV